MLKLCSMFGLLRVFVRVGISAFKTKDLPNLMASSYSKMLNTVESYIRIMLLQGAWIYSCKKLQLSLQVLIDFTSTLHFLLLLSVTVSIFFPHKISLICSLHLKTGISSTLKDKSMDLD